MATAEIKASPRDASLRQDWILANPWLYTVVGLLASVLALATTHLLGPDHHFIRGFFFLIGLTGAGIGIVLRLNSSRPAFIDEFSPQARALALKALGLLYFVVALGMTALLVMSILELSFIPWRWGSTFVVWAVLAPISFFACKTCWVNGKADTGFTWGHEAACLLVLAGLACIACVFSLHFGHERRFEWSTMRLFLSVAAFAALAAAPLFLVPQTVRRVGLSVLFLLHFGGIATAATAAPPYPWIIGQLWVRIYRPYLEFMYLNNAYHFYAPEPGPSSYMWFRLFYEDKAGKSHAVWYKIPNMDETGWHGHTVALEYQRYLSLTENVSQGMVTNVNLIDNSANPLFANKDDDHLLTYNMTPPMKARWRKTELAIYFKKMKEHIEKQAREGKEAVIGIDIKRQPPKLDPMEPININPVDHPDVTPFHPMVPIAQQYMPPREGTQRLVESYVRHVARRPHPEHPDWTVKKVKVYKVRHTIFPDDALNSGMSPLDPIYYQPFYLGEYDENGRLLDPTDPLLYWLMPVMRRNYNDPASLTANFALRHAGDKKWASDVTPEGTRRWFEPTRGAFDPPKR